MKFSFLAIILFLLIPNLKAQYSNYYNINSKLTATINENVTGSININKTITNIDYGQLAIANAQREKNALELQKIQDERARQIAIAIAEDPVKAYEYGQIFSINPKDKKQFPSKEILQSYQESIGFKNFRLLFVLPYGSLFSLLDPLHMQNSSKDGIVTDIIMDLPSIVKDSAYRDIEQFYSSFDTLVGKETEIKDELGKTIKRFYHKNTLSRTTIAGNPGYRNTLIWEDKFEYAIIDRYAAYVKENEIEYTISAAVRIHGDKNETTFEKIEGRRYYFKQLIEKIISTARVNDLVLLK